MTSLQGPRPSLPHESLAAKPAFATQRSGLAQADELEVVWVAEVTIPTGLRKHALRGLAEVGRDAVAKCLVRTELVVLAAEVGEGPLLSTQGAARRHGECRA